MKKGFKRFLIGFLIFILLAGGAAAYWYFGVYKPDQEEKPDELTVSDIIESSSRKMLEVQRGVQVMSRKKLAEEVAAERDYQHDEFSEFFNLISGGYGYFYPVDSDGFESDYETQNITKALYVTDFIQKNATATSGFEEGFKTNTLYIHTGMEFKFYATMENGLVTVYFRDGLDNDHYDQTKIDIKYNSKGVVYEMNIAHSALIDGERVRIIIANIDFLTNKFYGGIISNLGYSTKKPTLTWLIDGQHGLSNDQGTGTLFQKLYNYSYMYFDTTVTVQTVDMSFSNNNSNYVAQSIEFTGKETVMDYSEIQPEWGKVYDECKDYAFKTTYEELNSSKFTTISGATHARDYAENRVYVQQGYARDPHEFCWLDFDELKKAIEIIHPMASVLEPVNNDPFVHLDPGLTNSEDGIAAWNAVVEEINNTDASSYYSMDQFTTFSLEHLENYSDGTGSRYKIEWGGTWIATFYRNVNGDIRLSHYGGW